MRKIAAAMLALALLLAACGEGSFTEAELRGMLEAKATREILAFEYGDYDGDGVDEAFALVGAKLDDGSIMGELWYAGPNGAQMLEASETGYWGLIDVFVFGGRRFAVVEEYYTTGALVNLWGVKDGQPYREKISGHGGGLKEISENSFLLYHSALDAMLDAGLGFCMGRTWKPYWFHWDGDGFREYGGTKITEEQLRRCEGAAEILDGIYGITGDIFYRGNGIININHTVLQSEGDIGNYCVTVQLDGESVAVVETGDPSGFYLPALAPDIAAYPELPEIFN